MQSRDRGTLRRLAESPALERARVAAELLDRHGASFRATARRFSSDDADADDALQRAAEILLTKAPVPEGRDLRAWMHVVTRREALAVGRARRRRALVLGEPVTPERAPSPAPGPERILELRERAAVAARSLAALKPHERRAIALQAAGCSYAEIQAITGWSYTKVNRCLGEGRARLRSLGPQSASA